MRAGLIGRDHPVGVLRAEIGRATGSYGGLVLVTGEAGIGKTTLVTDAMEVAREQGALVLSGSCWDSSAAPGYWPWVQVVRALRRQAAAEEWAAAEQAGGERLAVLLGEPGQLDPADQFDLYDAVTSALVAVSQRRPVVVVLDDLHWADPSSVRLLEFVAQHTWFERLLLVGTYRDVEVEATGHPLAPLMLPLLAKATTVTLTGLDRDEVGALMTRTVGIEPDPDLVEEVHLRTGGNPFFVEQTVRLWHSGGSVTDVAPGVSDAVRRRLSLLPPAVSRLLTAAAVLGREFHRQVLSATVSAPVAQVDRQLGQAVAARLVSALGDGRFAFAHDLVRETLYTELDEPGEWHAAVVRALDRSAALTARIFPADLARHAYLGRSSLEAGRVVDLLLAAAKDARRRSAYEECANHYRRAIELLDQGAPRRSRIALDFGVLLHHASDRDEAWALFDEVAGAALAGDDVDVLARTALTLYGLPSQGDRTKLKADLLNRAYERLVPGAEPPAGSLDHLAQEVIVRLIAIARNDGDDDVLGFSLWTQHDQLWGLGHAAERLALTDELAGISRRTNDTDTELYAVSLGWVAKVELGDPGYYERYRQFVATVATSPPSQITEYVHIDSTIIATLRGRFDEAAGYLAEFREPCDQFAVSMVLHLQWAMALLRGRFDELADIRARAEAAEYPYRALLEGITAATRGDAVTARGCLAELESAREPMSKAYEPLLIRLRVQLAVLTGDVSRCRELHDELVPHAGTWLVSMYGCDVSGPVTLWLGRLALARGDTAAAVPFFEAARDSADLLGARPWVVEANAGLVSAGVAELRASVAGEAAALGMKHLAENAEPLPHNEFRFTGETWSLSMAGLTVHVPDSKGLRDLHVLLRAPGKEIPATRLLNPAGGETVTTAASMGGDALLDEEAKSRYRTRLSTLDDLIAAATESGDDQKAAAYDREREALLTELRTATGLGGRTRRLGDEAERARKTVTARIRDTLRKLDTSHPKLAAHLRTAISTGTTCSYQPKAQTTWHL
jgi:hypothetical protein